MRVLVLALADASKNPRPNRLLNLLVGGGHDVTFCGLGPHSNPQVAFQPISPAGLLHRIRKAFLLKTRQFSLASMPCGARELQCRLEKQDWDAVVSHDLELLPFVFKALPGVPVYADIREFFPRHFDTQWHWRFLFADYYDSLCREYLPKLRQGWTVSEGLARLYRDEYQVELDVVHSLPPFADLLPSPKIHSPVRLVHHGSANSVRCLENMIAMMDVAGSEYQLDIILVPNQKSYARKLERLASERSNVNILPPVPFEAIIPTLHKYDIGVYTVPPTTTNLRHAMPNKLFEFVQARLPILCGPGTTVADYVAAQSIGFCAQDYSAEALARCLSRFDADSVGRLNKVVHDHAATCHQAVSDSYLSAIFNHREGRQTEFC
jgi:hypothetical protein